MKINDNSTSAARAAKSFQPGTVVKEMQSGWSDSVLLIADPAFNINQVVGHTLVINLNTGLTFWLENDRLLFEVEAELTLTNVGPAAPGAEKFVYLNMKREYQPSTYDIPGHYTAPMGKIPAIKAVKALQGCDLRTAKDIVDEYIRSGEAKPICLERTWEWRDRSADWSCMVLR